MATIADAIARGQGQKFDREQRARGTERQEQVAKLQGIAFGLPQQQQQQSSQFSLANLFGGGQQAPAQPQVAAQPQLTQQDAMLQLAVLDPVAFQNMEKSVGLIDQGKKNRAADFGRKLLSVPFEQRGPIIEQRIKEITARGGDPSDTISMRDMDDAGHQQVAEFARVSAMTPQERAQAARGADVSAADRGFEELISGFSDADKISARRRRAGVEARAVGSAAGTIASEGRVEDVAEVEKILKKAGESGKLEAQRELKPEIEAKVRAAVAQSVAVADQTEEARSNRKAKNVYDAGISALTAALGGTTTGPIAGRLVSLTASQQIADGAVAAMAPILKQMFRSAGEGSFTDSDQALLMAMIPTRTDKPEAIKSKLANIDMIVNAKLDLQAEPEVAPVVEAPPPVTSPPQEAQAAPPTVTTQAEVDALPSGTLFIEDGVTYRKP